MTPAPRVLIVDDEPNIVLSLEFLLTQAGFEVVVARDGPAALDEAARRPPSVVLLDLMLPGLDGYEVCRQLRERPDTAGCKIILLTARGRDADRVRGFEEGADRYITKPFSTRELVDAVIQAAGGGSAT